MKARVAVSFRAGVLDPEAAAIGKSLQGLGFDTVKGVKRTKLIEQVPLLKNTRITLGINNLFDAQQRVTDSAGTVPLRYQPALLDPNGRFVELELRKLF